MKTFPPPNRPPRILVTRTDRIGDFILSTPVFKALRDKYPEAWIAGLTFTHNRDLIEGNPFLDEVLLYDKQGSEKGWWGNFRFALKLAKGKYDLVIHLHATNRMHYVTWFARIPNRIGWNRRAAWTLTRGYPYIKPEGLKHEAEYNFDLLESLAISCPKNLETFFPLQPRWKRSLEELLAQKGLQSEKPWVVFNPSASDTSKMWPLEKFCRVADQIHTAYDVTLISIGSRNDLGHVHAFNQGTKAPILDLSGSLSLSMLGHLLKDAKLLISNDSGPIHIAQALGTDVVSIFHQRLDPGLSPKRWQPLYDNASVVSGENISVEDIMAATALWLKPYKKVTVIS